MKVVIDNSKGTADVIYKDKGVEVQVLSPMFNPEMCNDVRLYVFVWDEEEEVDKRNHVSKEKD